MQAQALDEQAKMGVNPLLERYHAVLMHAALAGNEAAVKNSGAALKNLQRGLTGDRQLPGAGYLSSREHLSAYLSYYWPVSFAQTMMALEELRLRGFDFAGKRALDLGAGPGPGAAALTAFRLASVDLIDAEAPALAAARTLASRLPGLENTQFRYTLLDVEREKPAAPGNVPGDSRVFDGTQAYDLILACHSINELWKNAPDAVERRAETLRVWSRSLAPGGILLVIEPSALVTSRPALALRDTLLAREQSVAREQDVSREPAAESGNRFSCVAPCPGSFPCPLLAAGENRSCHSTWAWDPPEFVAKLAKAAGLDRDSAKATWFALQKTTVDDAVPARSRHQLSGRIVSEPMLNKAGRVRFVLCSQGALATLSAKKNSPGAASVGNKAEDLFFSLQRGDVIEADNLEPRGEGQGFGLTPATQIGRLIVAPRV